MQVFRLSTNQVKFHRIPHFSNKKSVFLQNVGLFSVSWVIILLHFFSWNYWKYAIEESSTSKCKFSDLLQFALRFTKFLKSFSDTRVSFSPTFASLFSIMRHNSFVPFHLNLCIPWTKGSDQSANFQTSEYSYEN